MSVISTNIVHKSSENDQINTSNANGKPAPSSSQTLMKIGTYHDKGATFKKFKDEKVPSPKEQKQVIKIEATDVDSIKNEPNLEI